MPPCVGPLLGWQLNAARRAPYSNDKEPDAAKPPSLKPTVTVPAPCTGTLHAIKVDDRTRPCTVWSCPNLHRGWPLAWKCWPEIVTIWPSTPLSPLLGLRTSMVAPVSYVNSFPRSVKSTPPFRLTPTATTPVDSRAGTAQAATVDDTSFAMPTPSLPNLHMRPSAANPLPCTLTNIPPASVPLTGQMYSPMGAE